MASARKHNISDDDILHAERSNFRTIKAENDPSLILVIGYSWSGAFIEVGIADQGTEDERIIHAMPLRPEFDRFLPKHLQRRRR